MSYLVQINEFLAETRDLGPKQLNKLIKELDNAALAVDNQAMAHTILGYMMSAKIKGETPKFEEASRRAANLKASQSWLFVEPITPAQTSLVPVDEKPKKITSPKQKTEKKSDTAKRIFDNLTDKTKANVIKVFMEQLGTTEAGASTYFYACGGEKTGHKTTQRVKASSGPTKRDLAQQLFDNSEHKDRASIVAKFVSELGLTTAGATTYYYVCGGAPVRRGLKAKK